MKHQPPLDPATVQAETTHSLRRDFETRCKTDLKKVGAAAMPPIRQRKFLGGLCRRQRPREAVAPGRPRSGGMVRSRANPNWTAVAHNDAFETAIEKHKLHPRLRLSAYPARASPLHPSSGSRARTAGQARPPRRRAGADESQGRRWRALDAPDVEAAEAALGEDPSRHLLARRRATDATARLLRMVDVEVEREADGRLCRSCWTPSRRCGCSPTRSTRAVFMSTGYSPRPPAKSPKPQARRSTTR